ncbi:Extracellular matrix protein FRAS1 [Melipona quadrifasciata]|uniref:Extracellular matrix protein FRAS1 n=1 Tax=Melipona quadrifasciata TaxID=166423 RepID=A0A0M8ZSA6_9HYME|nr:Extracellular matrix protein FRAS1 [Melipona quadrifasciata]
MGEEEEEDEEVEDAEEEEVWRKEGSQGKREMRAREEARGRGLGWVRYEGRRYQEGTSVVTSEPCLQCRCSDGALRCRLRVCPRLPNPPPAGCRVHSPGENVCCPELVCDETRYDAMNMLRRSNVRVEESEKIEAPQNSRFQGCLHEGVRYGPGSAMMGSRRCEYCYCISGTRRCIRPRCLLPLPGCTPLYAPQSCCPVAYNCTRCRVGSRIYEEGEMVRDIEWKAACDNCFCAMGAVRCVPLACAPPLQGCSPIVREGHCCPSTYNCSGSIEVKATQNYASYAFISKDYAKFRKETNFFPAVDQVTNPPVEGRGHRVVEERIDSSTKELVEESSSMVTDSTSWPATFETDIMDNEILETVDYVKSSPEIATTTSATVEESTTSVDSFTVESTLSIRDDDLSNDSSTIFSTNSVVTELQQPEGEKMHNVAVRNKNATSSTSGELEQDFEHANSTVKPMETTESMSKGSVTRTSSSVVMPDDILVMNVTVKTNVSVGHIQGVTINPIRSIPPDVEAILNITHREKGEDYDYDYSEPTLPPSLPNVRIIPFVAADALVKDKTVPSPVTGYPSGSVVVPPELRPTDTSGFYDIATQENRFSPPVETEAVSSLNSICFAQGGFVPREPPYFDAPYHSTDLNLEIGTGVTVVPAPITNPHRKSDASNCLFENMEYRHGEILPSSGICVICMCYYGEVVCSSEKCPPLKIGCRRINTEETCCGKIVCVEAEESPTLVLDRADATAPSLHQPIVSPDPFRDVIKTEPAPDLPSLIEDMIPYLVEHGITTPRPSTTSTLKPLQANFDFVDKLALLRPPYRPDEDPIRLISKNKYNLNQDEHPEEAISPSYNSKEAEQTPNRVSETIPEKTGPPITDHTTKKQEEQTVLSLLDATNSNFIKSNTSNVNTSTNVSSESKLDELKLNNSKLNNSKYHSATSKPPSTELEDPIFSLDSVLDLLFSSDMNNNQDDKDTKATETSTTSRSTTDVSRESEDEKMSSRASENTEEHVTESGTSSKVLENEIPVSVASLLKLAGCNIYGRMYRVGRIITELSGPCLECRCTEIGVQCKQLKC